MDVRVKISADMEPAAESARGLPNEWLRRAPENPSGAAQPQSHPLRWRSGALIGDGATGDFTDATERHLSIPCPSLRSGRARSENWRKVRPTRRSRQDTGRLIRNATRIGEGETMDTSHTKRESEPSPSVRPRQEMTSIIEHLKPFDPGRPLPRSSRQLVGLRCRPVDGTDIGRVAAPIESQAA